MIRPGDRLVLRFARQIDAETAQRLKERVSDRLPDVELVIVSGCDQMMVYRDGQDG